MTKRKLIHTHPILRSHLGFHGNLFGGQLMYWIDEAAAAYAMMVCHNRRVVTVCIDKCVFKKPVREGSLLEIYGSIRKIGNTSITLFLEAETVNVYTEERDTALSTDITFVRVDEDGNPIPISQQVKNTFSNNLE